VSAVAIGTGTRLVDDVDFVPVAGRGLYLVAATFREERDVHCFVDGTLRVGLRSLQVNMKYHTGRWNSKRTQSVRGGFLKAMRSVKP
jgi:hypothetical protein